MSQMLDAFRTKLANAVHSLLVPEHLVEREATFKAVVAQQSAPLVATVSAPAASAVRFVEMTHEEQVAVINKAFASSPSIPSPKPPTPTSQGASPVANEFQTIIIDAEKGIQVGVADALKILGAINSKAPAGTTALTALAGAVDKALADAAVDAANPTQLIITLPSQVSDFKAVWSDGKALLASIGVK